MPWPPAGRSRWKPGRAGNSSPPRSAFYELKKRLLKGDLKAWPTVLEDIAKAVEVVPVTAAAALKAGQIAHATGMPAFDALIVSSLAEAGCEEILTLDHHFTLVCEKGADNNPFINLKCRKLEKFQITNPKFQINSKLQIPIDPNKDTHGFPLRFGHWSLALGHLFAIWCLEFGTLSPSFTRHAFTSFTRHEFRQLFPLYHLILIQ